MTREVLGRAVRGQWGRRVGALAMLTSAGNKTCKKVFNAKQGNDCLIDVLGNTKDKIGRRGAVDIQGRADSCKEPAEAVLETPVMEAR